MIAMRGVVQARDDVRRRRAARWCSGLRAGSRPDHPAQAALATPSPPAPTQQADAQQVREELDRLRQEFEAIRDAYGARLAALEAKLGAAPATRSARRPVPAAGAQPPRRPRRPPWTCRRARPAPADPQGALPVYGNASALSKIFNPDIAVIGNFLGAAGENTIDPRPALELDEAEATLPGGRRSVRARRLLPRVSPEGLEIEEGFLTLTTLPGGLLAKVGKLKEQFGKVNTLHAHALPWVDAPLVMKNLLGGEEGLDGFGHLGVEADPEPVVLPRGHRRGVSGQLRAVSDARAQRRELGRAGCAAIATSPRRPTSTSARRSPYGHNDAGPDFTTRLVGIDATVRYRPLRRAIYRRFMGRTELFWSRRGQEDGDVTGLRHVCQRRLSVRAALVRRRAATTGRSAPTTPRSSTRGRRSSLTYWPSEFSQIRGQYRRTRYAEGVTANEVLFQFLFSIGAHGAHVF